MTEFKKPPHKAFTPEHGMHAALSYLHSEASRNGYHTLAQILELALEHAAQLINAPDEPPADLGTLIEELTLIRDFRQVPPEQRQSVITLLQSLNPNPPRGDPEHPHY